ncbi:MarR family winged helix-turn-helix transcriptional regulator [Govanella unica]|uniref:MarR family winged helix-turn-helix transcriptional regulator n=1 Tax=Govanella unica TaxID=2975056 RepID=A0A9X3TXZ9_9PROT|nr:MarR family winged helix-turn-helix transcriptional regulator [Govania unica]MDA5193432.1 MarR family winged helix-turn-helix transcriptional regulator [Govania unica]
MTETREILSLEHFLPYRLSVVSNLMSNAIAGIYSDRYKLGIPAWRVMAILGRFPGISAVEVAERGAMDKVAVSRAVSQLLADGRLERSFADDDRRRSVLRLSAEGWTVYDAVVPLALDYERRLIESLGADDRAALDRVVTSLTEKATALAVKE